MILLETTQKISVDSEVDAKDLIEKYRAQAREEGYKIKKASYEYKSKKKKGEIVAERWVVTIVKTHAALWEDLE